MVYFSEIEYHTMEKMMISNPKNYAESRYRGKGMCLDSCFLHNALINQVFDGVSEVISTKSWLDVSV